MDKPIVTFEPFQPVENVQFSTIELEKIDPKIYYRSPKTKLTKKQMKRRAASKRARIARRNNRKK